MRTLAERLRWSLTHSNKKQIELAEACGVTRSAVSHWLSGNVTAMEGKNLTTVGNLTGVNPHWLSTGEGKRLMENNNAQLVKRDDEIEILQFEAGGRMGNGGLVLQDQPGVIRSLNVSKEWLSLNVKGYNPASRLCIVTGFGDSMKPMYNPGDPLLVDLSVQIVEYDAVYFFRVGNEGFIKRLQRIPGEGLRVISANRDHYDPWTIRDDMDFQVLGRVLKVWKGDDF